jgi:hypothetical protein
MKIDTSKLTGKTSAQTEAKGNTPMHDAPLTAEEFAFLQGLGNQVALGETVRVDLAELLMDDDTVTALARYQDFFRYGDVDVGPALEALPHAVKLKRLKQRLDLASAMVGRQMAAAVKPVVGVVSDVRRMVAATPEGSSVRDAFATFDGKWREAFPGGGRPAKANGEAKAQGEAKADAAAPAKTAAASEPTK